jgi:hypothetical protein
MFARITWSPFANLAISERSHVAMHMLREVRYWRLVQQFHSGDSREVLVAAEVMLQRTDRSAPGVPAFHNA